MTDWPSRVPRAAQRAQWTRPAGPVWPRPTASRSAERSSASCGSRRRRSSRSARRAGTVQGEIVPLGRRRLAIRPTTGDALRTRSFRTVETTSGLSLITRNAQTNLDLRGTYRSDLRDAGDHVVGWLQVRVWEPSGRRVYEAVFPPGFPPVDMAAAAVALDSEVQWIRSHVTDSFQGSAPRIGR